MAVVGVWAERDPLQVARPLLPTADECIEKYSSALLATRKEIDGEGARIGHHPTQSRITLTNTGLLLERGAAWTAPIYYRLDCPIASSDLALLVNGRDALDVQRLAVPLSYTLRRDENRSIYTNIAVVRPFERVVLGRERHLSRAPFPQLEPVALRDTDALAGELRHLVLQAVERSTGTRRVALMLSGGLDSSSILAALMSLRGAKREEVHAVTLDFNAPGSDQPHVRTLEQHFGIHVIRARPKDAPVRESLILDGAPCRHQGDAWILACARHAHQSGAELLLTGTAGDQLYGGDLGMSVLDALKHRDLRGVRDAAFARFPHRASARHRLRVVAAALARPYLPSFVRRRRAANRLEALPDWAGPVLRQELVEVVEGQSDARAPRDLQERFEDVLTNPNDAEYGALARAQTDTVAAIPRLDPLYDLDLVRFLTAIPQQALFAGGTYRGLLRRAMHGLLPETVRLRTDKSDFEPALAEAYWPIDDLEPLLSFGALGDAGIVDPDKFRRMLMPLFENPRAESNGTRWLYFCPALAIENFLQARRACGNG